MAAVSRQVGYWKFLIWGESDARGLLEDSDEVVAIKKPDNFDVGAMRHKIKTGTLVDRVVVGEDKQCIVDGICILNTPNRTSFLRIGSAVEQDMKNIAIGSALLATAVAVSHLVVAKYPRIQLVSLIGSVAVTCFALLGYRWAREQVRKEQSHLWKMGETVAGWRGMGYSLLEGVKMEKCLQPFEGEALFRSYFSTWAASRLASQPNNPEEKKTWVERVLLQMGSLQRMAQQLLHESCVGSSTLRDTVAPVFEAWAEFRLSFGNRETARRLLGCKLYAQKDQTINFLSKFLPGIVSVYQGRTWNKTLSQTEKDKYEEYFFLACYAACKGTCLEEAARALIFASTFFCLNSFYYDEACLLFEATRQIVEEGQGTMPEANDYFKLPQSQGSLEGFSIDLDDAFRDRAGDEVSTRGTQEEYLEFLSEIPITNS